MTVLIVIDTVKDGEVLDEVGRSRAVIFMSRRGVRNSRLYLEAKKLARKMGVFMREITVDKIMPKNELELLSVEIGRFYSGSKSERIIVADKSLVVY